MSAGSTTDWDSELASDLREKLELYKKTTPQPYPNGISASSENTWLASIMEIELFLEVGEFAASVAPIAKHAPRNNVSGTLERIAQDLDPHDEYFEGYCLWGFPPRQTRRGECDHWVVRRHCWRVNSEGQIVDRAALSATPRSYFGIGFPADFVLTFRDEVVRACEKSNKETGQRIDPAKTSIPIISTVFLYHVIDSTLTDHLSDTFSNRMCVAYKQHVCNRFPSHFNAEAPG